MKATCFCRYNELPVELQLQVVDKLTMKRRAALRAADRRANVVDSAFLRDAKHRMFKQMAKHINLIKSTPFGLLQRLTSTSEDIIKLTQNDAKEFAWALVLEIDNRSSAVANAQVNNLGVGDELLMSMFDHIQVEESQQCLRNFLLGWQHWGHDIKKTNIDDIHFGVSVMTQVLCIAGPLHMLDGANEPYVIRTVKDILDEKCGKVYDILRQAVKQLDI